MGIKLNLGASPIWEQSGWHVLDHKLKESTDWVIAGDAANMQLPDESCDIVFCSHVIEHIPHTRLPHVLAEINRVLKVGGLFRVLTPDLAKVAKAYVERDAEFFRAAASEDESLRTDLGIGGMFMNFIVSPGQDTALLTRDLKSFVAGYAHLYAYDFDMLSRMLSESGFLPRNAEFCDASLEEMRVPLHVVGLKSEWQDLNQDFYRKNGLVHRLIDGRYEINFKVTGFDRDPRTSLIVEAEKVKDIDRDMVIQLFNNSPNNYNRYAWSLLQDKDFTSRLKEMGVSP